MQQQSQLRHSTSQSNMRTTQSTFSMVRSPPQTMGKMFARELQAQSSSSVDVKKQELIMKVMMMALEIQRKDSVVKNLLKELQTMQKRTVMSTTVVNSQTVTLRQQLSQSRRYIEEMEFKLQQMTISYNQLQATNMTLQAGTVKDLEQRVVILEKRNKELEIIKIQRQSQIQKLVTESKMLQFRLVNVESTQKGKLRQMQNVILQLQKRLDDQRKLNNQLKIVIQSKHEQLRVVKENQQRVIQQFNERFAQIKKDITYQEDLKRSQAVTAQQKIEMTQQELLRMQQEVRYWRQANQQLRVSFDKKEQQLLGEIKHLRGVESQLIGMRQQLSVMQSQNSQKSLVITQLNDELARSRQQMTAMENERQQSTIQIHETYERQVVGLREEVETYRVRMGELQTQVETLRAENRKMRRKISSVNLAQECQSCKILQSVTTIKSSTKLQALQLSLSEIIQQTERLRDTTVKIEQILSTRRVNGVSTYGQSRMSLEERSFYE